MSKYFNVEENREELKDFRTFLEPFKNQPNQLMQALHQAQDTFGFIPPEIQNMISDVLKVPKTEVYGVVTFYSRFEEVPKGETQISVCMGTACYVKGAQKILQEVEAVTGVKAGNTSDDGKISVSTTRCIGACSMAPIMTVNDEVYGKMTAKDVDTISEQLLGKVDKCECKMGE